MSTSLTITATAGVTWDFENSLAFGNTGNNSSLSYSTTLTNGTTSGKADLLYVAQGTIAASGNLALDLAGVLLDFFGNTITMVRLKLMYIENNNATPASQLSVGNGTNPVVNWIAPSTGTIKVRNGGVHLLVAPDATAYPITAATGDILKITNDDGANTATYKVCLAGASA